MSKDKRKVVSRVVDESNYYRNGNDGIFRSSDNRVYSFNADSTERDWSENLTAYFSRSNWDKNRISVAGVDIVSHGAANNLPILIRDTLEDQHLGTGVFKKKKNFLYGQGPAQYTIEYDAEGNRKKKWLQDADITKWLKSWAYDEFLRGQIVDFIHMEICYAKSFRNKGVRIGGDAKIAKLVHVPVNNARLCYPENGEITRILTGDFDFNRDFAVYPVFDKYDPFRFPVSIDYSSNYTFARDTYPIPSYYGTLAWLKRSASVPKVLQNLTDKSLNIRWHIESPAIYWVNKEQALRAKCDEDGVKYTADMLENLKDETFRKMGEVLSGVKNVGKFFTSETCYNEFGALEGWKITPIDQKVKEYIEGQIAIAKYADIATMSGLGLAPSLSDIMIEGMNSGSEKLYDYKLYMATQVDADEAIVCQTLNDAIASNFPEKDIKIGFYHEAVKTEDMVPPKDRLKNAVQK